MPAPSLRDIIQCAQTGVRSHDMTLFDVLRARQMQGGSIPESTIVGVPPISFAADGTPLSAWTVLGNTDLDIAPSPDNIIMPEFVGVRTANLFDKNDLALYYIGTTLGSGRKWSVSSSGGVVLRIPCLPLTDYTVSLRGDYAQSVWNVELTAYDTTPTSSNPVPTSIVANGKPSNLQTSFTTLSDTKFILIQFSSVYINSGGNSNIMLNAGNTVLPYEPYGYKIPITCSGTTYPIYLSAPIGAMDEHADAAASTGVVTRRVRKITFDGTESGWALFSGNGAYQFYIGNIISGSPAVNGSSALSNIAPYGATAATRADYQYGCYAISSGQGIAFQMYGSASAFPDVPAWKAFLAQMSANGTPVAAWYVLADPQEEAFEAPILTPTAGTNTLSVDTTLRPTSVSITGHIRQT